MKKISSAQVSRAHSRYYDTFLLLMKLSVFQFILIVAFAGMSYGFDSKAQELLNRSVSLHSDGQRLRSVLTQIEKQTTTKFVYSSRNIGADRPVTLHVNNVRLLEALDLLLKPLELTYRVINGHIILDSGVAEAEVLNEPLNVPEPEIIEHIVTGKVTDENGNMLPGVNIVVKGTQTGTNTNGEGSYKIAVADKNATLVFSFVGYIVQEKAIGSQTTINVQLAVDNKTLDEIVVVGYGTVKKSDLTGSVVTVGPEKLTAIPVTNALESLQGKVPGMDLTRSSGESGAGLNITLRGNRSLTASNAPLVIVDGIAYGSYIDINPNDIKSIEVLKDASAAAIYGSRGANGVILVTTKSGSSGKTKVEFNTYFGPNSLTSFQRPANTTEFIDYRRQAYRTAGVWNSPADDSKIFTTAEMENINKGISTDWIDLMLHNGFIQNYHLAVSGGNGKTTFRVSSEMFKEKGLMVNDQLNRFVQHANLEHQITDNLKIGTVLNFNYSVHNRRNSSLWTLLSKLPFGNPYEDDGSIRLYPIPSSTDINSLMDEKLENYKNETTTKRIFMTAFAEWKIAKNLVLKSSFGGDFNDQKAGIFEGKFSTLAFNNQGYSRSEMSNSSYFNWTWENTLTYQKTFGRHDFNGMLGTGLVSNKAETLSAQGKNQPFESAWYYNLGSNTTNLLISSSVRESRLASFFGRLNYKFDDKYLLTFTLRSDGASVLAKGNKWAYFPSAAFAWKVDKEEFMKQLTFVSDLKLRASYGVSGNSAISPYQTQGGLGKTGYAFDEIPAYGYRPTILSNQDLTWEKTASLNFGFDFGLFKNKISGSIDYYNTNTSDLLMTKLLPVSTGFSNVIANVGSTATNGIDIALSTVNFENGKFSWVSDLTFTHNKERIVALSTGQDDVANLWFIGQPLQVMYDYQKIGIWQLGEESQATKFNQAPGQIKIKDQDGDGVITAAKDRVILGQGNPKWTGSLNNTFRFGNFTLSALLYARVGHTIRSEYASYFRNSVTQNTTLVDYWTPENPTNDYPRPSSSGNILYQSALVYRDGTFLKIRDIRLSYDVPVSQFKKLPFRSVKLYATAKNYFSFSKFKDYDPERGGSVSYPLTKQLVFGMNLSF